MKHRNYYSRCTALYPSEMGSDCFGLYRNLVKENNIGNLIKHEKFEDYSKSLSKKLNLFNKKHK